MFITFQDLQLAADLSYSLLNMNIKVKVSINANTKKLHCIGSINYNAIKWNREIISVSSKPHRKTFA